MTAIYKHELHSYFNNLSAYVFGAFMLLFAGIYTAVMNVQVGVANFEYSIQAYTFIFIVTVPVITMRIFADERRQRTDQLLYSLPLSMSKIVLGKFFALLTVFAVPVLVMCVYPLILSAFGNVNMLSAYATILAFFLLGAALLSIGMFISSLTESLAVAAGVTFVAMLLNYFLSNIADYLPRTAYASFIGFMLLIVLLAFVIRQLTKNTFVALIVAVVGEAALLMFYNVKKSAFTGLLPDLVTKLSLYEAFQKIPGGMFDIASIVYMLSVTVFFVFLTVQTLEKRRWS